MAQLIDLTGQRFDKLVVLEKAPPHSRHVYWKCQCDCGNIVEKSGESLRRKTTSIKDCGCSKQQAKENKELLKKQKKEYLVGKRFGKLVVIKLIEGKRVNRSLV